jgi:hypothetical protein
VRSLFTLEDQWGDRLPSKVVFWGIHPLSIRRFDTPPLYREAPQSSDPPAAYPHGLGLAGSGQVTLLGEMNDVSISDQPMLIILSSCFETVLKAIAPAQPLIYSKETSLQAV